jgi:hypothetical protein
MRLLKSYRALSILAVVGLALVLLLPASSVYYEYQGGKSCARCHEINDNYKVWLSSSHRRITCGECHGSIMSLDVGFHAGNLRRVVKHVSGSVPDQIRLKESDLPKVMERCRNCHQQEFAQWQAGPHSVTYERIFLDKKHNSQRLLMDDCLRCHGMHFEGGIRDLVTPVNTSGPWSLKRAGLAKQPAIPCLACHQVHAKGEPLPRGFVELPKPGPAQEINRPSIALFDRREMDHFSVKTLPMPQVLDGGKPLRMSPDSRQALCYQCHAPLSTMQAGSGDDRTAMGVHEGLSCLACHQKHAQNTRASCANCHPRLSNCGIDVEKMDTTFLSRTSTHNIHFVKCIDCHPKGVPAKKKVREGDRLVTEVR